MKLHLTLKKKWFDMILTGIKKEEYREIKPYWEKRLFEKFNNEFQNRSLISDDGFIGYDRILFKNGYSKNAPSFEIDCLGIEIGEGKTEWGAEKGKQYFILKLGRIITGNHNLIQNH